MGRPDALLRWADHPRGVDDNVDFTLLSLEVFELRVTEAITLEGEEAVFMEQIQQSSQVDDAVGNVRETLVVGCFFFFQAEDGIRDIGVTGVQTCALPI